MEGRTPRIRRPVGYSGGEEPCVEEVPRRVGGWGFRKKGKGERVK